MESKELHNEPMPARNWGCLLFCGVGLLAFAIVAVYPTYREIRKLDAPVRDREARIAEQSVLQPAYTEILSSSAGTLPADLEHAETVHLPGEEITKVPELFVELTRSCGLEMSRCTLSVRMEEGGGRYLMVQMSVRGRFLQFRDFLLKCAALPSFSRVERLQVEKVPTGEEMRLWLWLVVEG